MIINVTPGILPIPPNGWGAVEKIIWEYHQNFIKKGYDSKILYLDEVEYKKSDIIHIHVANLALLAKERNIPYYFTCHDHHAFLYGKNSDCFKQNYDAIKYSVKSFVPAKYLVDYFNLPNLYYLSHGVNLDVFKSRQSEKLNHKLLCVANNGFFHDVSEDRKGFKYAIETAKHFNLPITIAGPSNNKNFFNKCDIKYDKLNVLFDLKEDDLVKLYQEHSIFLHPSILEAGHPNLTLLEAMSCGLVVLATFEENNDLQGLVKITRNVDSIIKNLNYVLNNYDDLRLKSLECIKLKSWENITNILLEMYTNKNATMKEQLIEIYTDTVINHIDPKVNKNNKIIIDYNDGCKVEILGEVKNEYIIKFKNRLNNTSIYESKIQNNMWAKSTLSYFIDWDVEIIDCNTKSIQNYKLDLKNKQVRIVNESPSLGDYIAWVPFVDLFQKKHECIVDFYTPNKELFESSYPNINFYNYNDIQNVIYTATYKIGCFDPNNKDKSPRDYRTQNLQEIAADILGIEYKDTKPILNVSPFSRKLDEKYVCISTASTAGCKHWQNETGWQQTVDYLNELGYKVVVIQNQPLNYMDLKGLNNVLHPKTSSLTEAIEWLYNCEFYIGLSSGISWLAWSLNKKVIMISGFTKNFNEFHTPFRIANESVCNGCWNNTRYKFDPGDWNWCPVHKNTNKQFECSKTIDFDSVKNYINKVIRNEHILENFDEFTYKEIYEWNQYEKFVQVENKDFVVDLGCSKGYFYFKHKDKNINYLGVDGSIDCLKDFIENLKETDNPKLLHTLISDGKSVQTFKSMFHNNNLQKSLSITFKDFVNIINKPIDFLKFDIEGYEKTFLDENYDLFKSNVRKFSGEVHFNGLCFHRKKVYDVLNKIKSDKDITMKLYSIDGIDITEHFWTNSDYYTEIIMSGYVNSKII